MLAYVCGGGGERERERRERPGFPTFKYYISPFGLRHATFAHDAIGFSHWFSRTEMGNVWWMFRTEFASTNASSHNVFYGKCLKQHQ